MSDSYPPAPEPAPAPAGEPASPAPAARPDSVSTAVRLMYAGAALSLVSVVLAPLSRDAVRRSIEDAVAGQDTVFTPEQIDGFVTFGIVTGILFGLLGVVLWLLMARANGQGRGWARIMATVLFALDVVSLLGSIPQVGAMPLAFSVQVLITVVGVVVVVLLWRKDSSAWFQARSVQRR